MALLFSVNTKNISSHVLKISENSLALRTGEFTDIFITFDEIYLVFTSKNIFQIQSTLVISKLKRPSETLRDIRTLTYQIF